MDSSFLLLDSLSISDGSHQFLAPTITGTSSSASRLSISKIINKNLDYILFLASSGDDSRDERGLEMARRTARASAQVCRRWRATALNTPRIWLGPVLSWYSQPKWLEIVLERSKPLPLEVVILDAAVTRKSEVLPVILRHIGRIRHLDLTLDLTRQASLWQSIGKSKLLQQQAPCLQSFFLNVVLDVETRRQIHVTEPENLFSNWAPMLRHLRVQDWPINLAPKMYSGLRYLSLHNTPFMSPVQVLDVLRNMKYLEHFYLAPPLGNAQLAVECPDVPPVYLLNLNRLQIAGTISMCASIFKHLQLPLSCSIQLDCHHAYGGQHLGEILSRMKEILLHWRCEPLTGRQHLSMGATHIKLAMEAPPDIDEISNREHPDISLALFWQSSPTSFYSLLSLFPPLTSTFRHCDTPPDSLHIYADTKIPAELRPHVSNWLRKMRGIQAIEFQSHEAFALFEPILRPPRNIPYYEDGDDGDYNPQIDDNLLLPILGDLTFVNINFTTEKRRYWKRLMKTLKGRDRAESPIQQIDFVQCFGDYNPKEANRYVADVKVNGQYYNNDDDDDGDSDGSNYTIQANSDIE